MENIKMPFLPEETLRTQRVEIYLNDLKTRLKELRHQHDEVIQNSVDIIKEIDEVSSSLLLPQSSVEQSDSITKIKKLIQEFETAKEVSAAKTPVAIGSRVDINKILQNFEKLNESQVLKDSLVLFKRAKESFEKIDTFFGRISSPSDGNGKEVCATNSLRHKINMFNGGKEMCGSSLRDIKPSHYASCCSSAMSIETFHSAEELGGHLNKGGRSTTNSLENGYEGDNDDSEYDLFAMKKKKSKCLHPPSM